MTHRVMDFQNYCDLLSSFRISSYTCMRAQRTDNCLSTNRKERNTVMPYGLIQQVFFSFEDDRFSALCPEKWTS